MRNAGVVDDGLILSTFFEDSIDKAAIGLINLIYNLPRYEQIARFK